MSILSFVRHFIYFITSFLSCQELFLFSFFKFLMCSVVFHNRWYVTISFLVCQQVFLISFLLLFCRLSLARSSNVDYFTTVFILCQQLFFFFLYSLSCVLKSPDFEQQNNGEGGLWTLAPRKRPTPLAGAPLQPLEYFSICLNHKNMNLLHALSNAWLSYQRNGYLSILFFNFFIKF